MKEVPRPSIPTDTTVYQRDRLFKLYYCESKITRYAKPLQYVDGPMTVFFSTHASNRQSVEMDARFLDGMKRVSSTLFADLVHEGREQLASEIVIYSRVNPHDDF